MHWEQLNEAQRRAVMHGEGPLLVLAGPGSGKTLTITQRIFYLIREMQVPPEEILVITFTKEAAASMQRRFQEQSDLFYPVNFGTFHSVFYHILKQSAPSGNRILLKEQQKKNLLYPIIKTIKREIEIEAEQGNGKAIGKQAGVKIKLPLQQTQTQKTTAFDRETLAEESSLLLSVISYYKNTGNLKASEDRLPQEWRAYFQTVYSAYERVRKQENAIDFDDMVYECAGLLKENTQVRSYWQSRFSHILMDEFQDISPMQYRVVGLLSRAPHNLFAVGDDDQAIYGFRGANPGCLLQFVREYQAKQVLLNINYRCHKEIIRASLLVIEDNRERFAKKLVAAEGQERGILCQKALPGQGGCQDRDGRQEVLRERVVIRTFTEREEQYQYLAGLFSQKKDRDACAVLFRTNFLMQGFAAMLKSRGIPFIMKEKAVSIYEQTVVRDVMAYLRLASGEQKRELWMQVINKPSRYVSREAFACGEQVTIGDIRAYYSRQTPDSPCYPYVEKIREAICTLERQLQVLKKASPFLAVQYVRKAMGYEAYVKGCRKSDDGLALLDWLSGDAKGYATLEEWLDAQRRYGEMLAKAPAKREMLAAKDENACLHLMTVHASKGLEFDYVWLADCNEKVFPHGNMPDQAACEEERRIFYVGMTRAKKSLELLCLTGTKERPRLPSRFLNHLWKDYSSSSTSSSNSH